MPILHTEIFTPASIIFYISNFSNKFRSRHETCDIIKMNYQIRSQTHRLICSYLVSHILLDIKFHKLNRHIFIISSFADPDFQVISDGLGEGLAEPWRVVELAAGAGGTTQ